MVLTTFQTTGGYCEEQLDKNQTCLANTISKDQKSLSSRDDPARGPSTVHFGLYLV